MKEFYRHDMLQHCAYSFFSQQNLSVICRRCIDDKCSITHHLSTLKAKIVF